MKVVTSRPRHFHLNLKMKLPYKTNITSSEGTDTYREMVDERPIRVDHGLVGERESEGNRVLMECHMKMYQNSLEDLRVLKCNPFCMLY